MREFKPLWLRLYQDPRHRTPYGAETEQRNAQRLLHTPSIRSQKLDNFAPPAEKWKHCFQTSGIPWFVLFGTIRSLVFHVLHPRFLNPPSGQTFCRY